MVDTDEVDYTREYFVRFLETPSSRLDNEIGFRIKRSDGEIRKCRVEQVVDREKRPLGLMFTEILKAESIDAAIGAVHSDLGFISSLIAFTSGVSVSEPRFHVAFTIDKDKVIHQFRQRDEVRDYPYSTGNTKTDIVQKVIEKLDITEDEGVRERLMTSFQIFRKAQGIEDDPFQKFILLWISLELVDHALLDKLEPPNLERCSACGQSKGSRLGRGLRELVKNDSERKLELKEATDLRNEIMHRARDFARLRNQAQSKIPFITNLYITSLEYILDIPLGDRLPKSSIPRVATCYEINEELELSDPGAFVTEGTSEMPHIDIKHHPDEALPPTDQTRVRSTTTFTEVGFPKNIRRYIKKDTKLLYLGCKPEDCKVL